MDTQTRVALSGLSTICTTRRRGEETYERLLPTLQHGTVVLDLDGTDVVSASFLDGLTLKSANDGRLGNLVFATSDPFTKARLERLSGVRGVDIKLLDARGIARRVRKRTPSAVRPRFRETKEGISSPALVD